MSSSDRYGIAIDLGTTTIAAALVQLSDGTILATAGSLNPQRIHGLDVIARLQYAGLSAENLREMQSSVNSELSGLAEKLLAETGIDAGLVELIAIAGNPTMSHLLLGLPIDSLAYPPYRPRITGSHRVRSGALGWCSDFPLYVFPSPGGFVGGDTLAFLYGLGLAGHFRPRRVKAHSPEPALFLDLGTNGEIALLAGGKLFATSAAAGPAFEGGNLSCGMAALPGAIDAVAAIDGRLNMHTFANRPPIGICGSGVLDTVKLLLDEGLLDAAGCLLDPAQVASPLGTRLQELQGERHFVIYRDAVSLVSLSQADIRQVQLAKGAVRAGMEVLFRRAGITGCSVTEVVITGSFGASLALSSLKSVGVLTENMVKTARFVKEGVLAGVVCSLTSLAFNAEIEALAKRVTIVPLSGTPLFDEYFMQQMDFHGN